MANINTDNENNIKEKTNDINKIKKEYENINNKLINNELN